MSRSTNDIRLTMVSMVRRIANLAAASPLDHAEICRDIADEYDLWNDHGAFPIWLSRMVEGVIRDVESGEFDPRNV